MSTLKISGTCLQGDGYPNAMHTIKLLEKSGWDIKDDAYWIPEGVHLWRLARGPINKRLSLLITLVSISFKQAVMLLSSVEKNIPVYIPYPSVFTLWWLSWVPRRYRPYCISDAYISIWDSMFRDRSSNNEGSLVSIIIKLFEGRALRAANLVLSDTEANVHQLKNDFNISKDKLRSLPLAIDEELFLKIKPKEVSGKKIRVLFIGTMIPLHGIDIILESIHRLKNNNLIEFRLIGGGQLENKITDLIREIGSERVSWASEWQDNKSLAKELTNADICLGVFGGKGKAARVLPFKIYMALAAGRSIITQKLYSQPDSNAILPMHFVEPTADALAKEIITLSRDPELRVALGCLAREKYKEELSHSVILKFWESI